VLKHIAAGRRIVVGIDGSAASVAALRWAGREAQLRGTGLHAVYAWDGAERHRAPYAATNGVPSLDQDRATAASVLTAAVRAAFGRTPQAPLQAELAEGGAEGVLLDCAAGTELLVIGGTGRSNHLQPAAGPVHRACLAPPILLICRQ
jgi:nucleotide-binding universal stress UspA family protein